MGSQKEESGKEEDAHQGGWQPKGAVQVWLTSQDAFQILFPRPHGLPTPFQNHLGLDVEMGRPAIKGEPALASRSARADLRAQREVGGVEVVAVVRARGGGAGRRVGGNGGAGEVCAVASSYQRGLQTSQEASAPWKASSVSGPPLAGPRSSASNTVTGLQGERCRFSSRSRREVERGLQRTCTCSPLWQARMVAVSSFTRSRSYPGARRAFGSTPWSRRSTNRRSPGPVSGLSAWATFTSAVGLRKLRNLAILACSGRFTRPRARR